MPETLTLTTTLAEPTQVADTKPLIVRTGFSCYDLCTNPYEGCYHGCLYCYVRRAQAGPVAWGYWMWTRQNHQARLQAELPKLAGQRLAIGTNTDPYPNLERRTEVTRNMLQNLLGCGLRRIGIFTKSPLVVRDLELLQQFQHPHVHMTISPYTELARKMLEPGTACDLDRYVALAQLEGRVKRVVNVSPSIPYLSDVMIEEIASRLTHLGVEEICIGLTCLYKGVREALQQVLPDHPCWGVWDDPARYDAWRAEYASKWRAALLKTGYQGLAIFRDTDRRGWKKLMTGELLPAEYYSA